MKLLVISTLTFFLSLSSFASGKFQSFGKEVLYESNIGIEKFLEEQGFDLKSFDWISVVEGLNRKSRYELNQNGKIFRLYIPYKKPLYSWTKGNRSPASKVTCRVLDRKKEITDGSHKARVFIKYIDMITNRKKSYDNKKDMAFLKKNDFYHYPNSIKVEYKKLNKDGNAKHLYRMPLCADKETSRSIAYLNSKAVLEIKEKAKKSFGFSTSVSAGQIEINQNTNTADMDFFKLAVSGSYNVKPDLVLSTEMAVAHYYNARTDTASGGQSGSSIFPEFKIGLSKLLERSFFGVNINVINYFFIVDNDDYVRLEPSKISRYGLTYGYNLLDSTTLFISTSYIYGLEKTSLSGYDLSYGINYKFGSQDKYGATLLNYTSSIDSSFSSEQDTSNALLLNFSINF